MPVLSPIFVGRYEVHLPKDEWDNEDSINLTESYLRGRARVNQYHLVSWFIQYTSGRRAVWAENSKPPSGYVSHLVACVDVTHG